MAIAFTEACTSCKHLQTVYVEQEEVPSSGTAIDFTCAKCGTHILVYPGAFVLDQAIPDDAIVGQVVG